MDYSKMTIKEAAEEYLGSFIGHELAEQAMGFDFQVANLTKVIERVLEAQLAEKDKEIATARELVSRMERLAHQTGYMTEFEKSIGLISLDALAALSPQEKE